MRTFSRSCANLAWTERGILRAYPAIQFVPLQNTMTLTAPPAATATPRAGRSESVTIMIRPAEAALHVGSVPTVTIELFDPVVLPVPPIPVGSGSGIA